MKNGIKNFKNRVRWIGVTTKMCKATIEGAVMGYKRFYGDCDRFEDYMSVYGIIIKAFDEERA